ncbi:MAG: DUF4286 family protein [Bacteroidales bacterium]|nr:DUF4286 family protein [Bacteroidales bacterium]
MYLYNTTFIVANSEREWWHEWMRGMYIPTIRDIAPMVNFEAYSIDQNDSPDTKNFSCQWRCESLKELGEIDMYSKSLCSRMMKEKGEKCLFFSTMMKSVDFE